MRRRADNAHKHVSRYGHENSMLCVHVVVPFHQGSVLGVARNAVPPITVMRFPVIDVPLAAGKVGTARGADGLIA